MVLAHFCMLFFVTVFDAFCSSVSKPTKQKKCPSSGICFDGFGSLTLLTVHPKRHDVMVSGFTADESSASGDETLRTFLM